MDIGDDVPPKPRERLEIEDEDENQERIREFRDSSSMKRRVTSNLRPNPGESELIISNDQLDTRCRLSPV